MSRGEYLSIQAQTLPRAHFLYQKRWGAWTISADVHTCEAVLPPNLIKHMLSEFLWIFLMLNPSKLTMKEYLSHEADVKVTKIFTILLALTSHINHRRCSPVDGCVNFMDQRLINSVKPFAKFGRKFVGSIKNEEPTILDCLIRQSNRTSEPECIYSPSRCLKDPAVVVDRMFTCPRSDVLSFSGEVIDALKGYDKMGRNRKCHGESATDAAKKPQYCCS